MNWDVINGIWFDTQLVMTTDSFRIAFPNLTDAGLSTWIPVKSTHKIFKKRWNKYQSDFRSSTFRYLSIWNKMKQVRKSHIHSPEKPGPWLANFRTRWRRAESSWMLEFSMLAWRLFGTGELASDHGTCCKRELPHLETSIEKSVALQMFINNYKPH